jgi:uncharacterized membrane protein (DUF2068 family)
VAEEIKRPLGVTILGIFFILGGIFGIFDGLLFALFFQQLILGLVLVVLGVIMAIGGLGFFIRWKWAWFLAIVVLSIGILSEIGLILFGNFFTVIVLCVHLVILGYLFRGNVRTYFGT